MKSGSSTTIKDGLPNRLRKLVLQATVPSQLSIKPYIWWCTSGKIDYSFLPDGKTISSDLYCVQIDSMKKRVPRSMKLPHQILLQDNARPHTAKKTLQKLSDMKYEVLNHPIYSSDLAPTNFNYLRDLRNFLSGQQFSNRDAIKNGFQKFLASRKPEWHQKGINEFLNRWQKCVDCNGNYFD